MDIYNQDELIVMLKENSGLPGRAANLKLLQSFSDEISIAEKNEALFTFLKEMWQVDSNGDDPETMLTLCGLMGVSHYYLISEYQRVVKAIFLDAMNDERWRVREIIQEALKVVANEDYPAMIHLFSSITKPSMLDVRAMITTIAHPEILKSELQQDYAISMLEKSFDLFLDFEKRAEKKDDNFIALTKGLNFAPSVIVAKIPENGFQLLETSIGKSKSLNRIIKENLKKNRLIKVDKNKCEQLLAII